MNKSNKEKNSKTNETSGENEEFSTFLTGKAKENHEKQWEYIKEIFQKWKKNYAKEHGKKIEPTEIGIQRQLKASDKGLSELLRDGIELISNIRVASDRREIGRRKEESVIRQILEKNLHDEAAEALKKLDAIKSRWINLETVIDPVELHEGLENQRHRISELMHQKDGIINELKEAIVKSDERYFVDQQKQVDDIYCLVERIDMQVEVMKRSFREHLEILQNSIDEEKRRFLNTNSKNWLTIYGERSKCEDDMLDDRKDQAAFYENEINRCIREHKELIKSTKIRLDTDNDTLQIELENVKAEVMLNSEKLDYNYRILIKRADENIILRNQQKRRLSKLHEIISGLKERTKRTRKIGDNEIHKLTVEISKLTASIDELKTKSKIFAETNDQKFHSIWDISEAEALQLLEKIKLCDEIIYSQQLGIEWDPPHGFTIKKKDLPSFSSAADFLSKKAKRSDLEDVIYNENCDRLSQELESKFTKTMLDKISIQSQWLVDDKLDDILQPFKQMERTLVKIDSVFVALNINSMEDVQLLKEHFLYYSWCPNCSEGSQRNGVVRESSASSEKSAEECNNHYLTIESSYVLPALRSFVESRKKAKFINENKTVGCDQVDNRNITVSRLFKTEDILRFWKLLKETIPTSKTRLWNALEHGLNEYLTILKKREKLDTECELLRTQNSELKHLLQRYIPVDSYNDFED